MTETKDIDIFYENIDEQIYYWRQNIHRFVMEYMGLELPEFQQLLLYQMDSVNEENETSFIFFASRGLGKSFLTMTFCLAKAILYPGIKIVVASSVKDQALSFIKKAEEIKENKSNIEIEIESIKLNKENGIVTLTNGSTIEAVICSDNARGEQKNKARIASLHSNV